MDKRKLGKVLATTVGGIAALVILFSPGFVGLGLGGDAIHTSISIAAGITVPLAIGLFDKQILESDDPSKRLLDDGESDWSDVVGEFRGLAHGNSRLAKLASAAIDQEERLARTQDGYEKLIEHRFGKGTMSYDKFMAAVLAVRDSVKKNLVNVYNRMILFDEEDYASLQGHRSQNDEIDDDVQKRKLDMYVESLDTMKKILSDNENMLVSLDEFMMKISDADVDEKAAQERSEEIASLAEQLKYYSGEK
jgi:hypothetical protein